jgi:predicted LPLAT superfamily acyltransferase
MSSTTVRARWTNSRERSNRLAVLVMAWIALRLGRNVARWVLHPITLYFLAFAPAPRRQSARYLERVLGRRPSFADRYRHFHTFASTVLDRIYFVRGATDRFELQLNDESLVNSTLAEGRGTFLLGAHIGSFEALHAIGSSRPELRVAMVMYPENARLIHGVLRAIAPDFEVGIISIGRCGSTLAIRDWLAAGGIVGLLGDRFLAAESSGRGAVVELPFLGHPAPFTDGPLRLAMLLRQRVIFMVGLFRGGRRYDLRFETLADFRSPPENAAERERLLRCALESYVARLEALAREAPYNWFNFHDFWHEDEAD